MHLRFSVPRNKWIRLRILGKQEYTLFCWSNRVALYDPINSRCQDALTEQ